MLGFECRNIYDSFYCTWVRKIYKCTFVAYFQKVSSLGPIWSRTWTVCLRAIFVTKSTNISGICTAIRKTSVDKSQDFNVPNVHTEPNGKAILKVIWQLDMNATWMTAPIANWMLSFQKGHFLLRSFLV